MCFSESKLQQEAELYKLDAGRYAFSVKKLIAIASFHIKLADDFCMGKILLRDIFVYENVYIRIFALENRILVKKIIFPELALQILCIYSDPPP